VGGCGSAATGVVHIAGARASGVPGDHRGGFGGITKKTGSLTADASPFGEGGGRKKASHKDRICCSIWKKLLDR